MKKYLFPALALGLVMTSCQSDEPFAPVEGGEKQVTFTLNVPGDLGTRAGATNNASDKGGFSNGQGTLYYTLVLDANGDTRVFKDATVSNDGRTATFTPTVVLGRDYTITAYASFDDNTSINAKADIEAIEVSKKFNDESKDAYFQTTTHNFAEGDLQPLTLTRPFGKLRLVATDYQATGNGNTAIKSVKVKYNNNVFTTFNAVSGEFSNGQSYEHTLDGTNYSTSYYAPEKDENGNVTGQTIFADYVPVNSIGVAPFEITIVYVDGDEEYTRKFNQDIPVRRNALTTLKGNFFTANSEIKVEVKDAFEGQPENINFVSVSNASQLQEAIDNSTGNETITLTEDIDLNELMTRAADPYLVVNKNVKAIIDLNGKTLSAKSYQTGKNYNMIDINNGELTIKNGNIVYEHKGANMEWNSSTNIFNVTNNGVLNIEKVTAKNLGGSDMGFVAHLNNWGEVTLNVENSTLESNYVAVRVFNSGYDKNNVTIKNSTLKGGNYAFWVHNYTVADFGTQEKADAQKALLNFDIFNGTNTFEGKNDTPIRYGFTDAIYLEASGLRYENNTYYIPSANALVALSNKTIKKDEKVVLTANIDLTGVEFNGLSAFNPENNNTFDGQGYTVSNWTNKSGASDMGFFKSWVGTIKNINFVNCHLKTAGRSAIVAANTYTNIENVHVTDCSIEDSYWACGLIAGLYNAGSIRDCSATNSSVKSNGGTAAIAGVVNESAGTRSFTNCKVEGCTINNTGAYGEAYSGALLCGMINISNSTVEFKGCTQKDNTKLGKYVGDLYYAADEDITIVVE